MILRTPWANQPQFLTRLDPYWVGRGLSVVFAGNRVIYNRDSKVSAATLVGGPKLIPARIASGVAVTSGFGSTYGTGLTDYISGIALPVTKRDGRSVVAHVYPNTTGGGGLGRVFQDVVGTGQSSGESFYLSTVPGITHAITSVSSTLTSTWTPAFTVPTGRWCTLGISVPYDFSSATTARGFLDGVYKAGASNGAATVALTSNVESNLAFGNRPAAPGNERYWDGMIGIVLIFDGVLSDGDHAMLAANPWQVFAPVETFWFGQGAASGSTITGAIGTAVASGLTGTVNANRTIAGALGAATATGFLGVVNANRTISGAFGTAVASGLAGNVYANRTIAGALGTATASGFQGAVTNGNTTTITGALGTAVATGFTGGVAWNRYIAGLLGVATASGFTGGVANGTAVAGRRRTSQRKILVTIKGARFLVPEDQLDEWLDDKEEELVEQAIKPVTVVSKKARVIRANTSPVPKVAAQADEAWVAAAVAELNRRVQQRIADERKRLQDEDDEEVMLLLL